MFSPSRKGVGQGLDADRRFAAAASLGKPKRGSARHGKLVPEARNRTRNHSLTRRVLYHLSYSGNIRIGGDKPADKPGSVEGNHSSRAAVADGLKQPTRKRV